MLAFLAYPSHVLMYAPGDSLRRRLDTTRNPLGMACDTESQEDLYAGVPIVGRLTGIKEMKVEAVTVGKHHNMCCPPYVRHSTAIIFHFGYLSWISRRWGYFIQEMALFCEEDQ
ncbi:hypothetical protein C3432_09610 [Citrobacter amalonaticus]|uniref:Uncharacterized protein n=1 Tax=Citrobacter amalonaticus TaxID=35703 RepID=A0A2S4RZU0_CITAM|nr:hypothetical protein C3432_09610 [Citrobacter amalonaticus]POT76313.1 hypothetical protein C3436_02215 [Citrobacter amalonaticus]POU66688.1 hypothetical protein C3430_07810 [Citrobacter amalonaticus]POV05548.1 hypothetical protein C3424_09520 [Citrobacter amalonaticus]